MGQTNTTSTLKQALPNQYKLPDQTPKQLQTFNNLLRTKQMQKDGQNKWSIGEKEEGGLFKIICDSDIKVSSMINGYVKINNEDGRLIFEGIVKDGSRNGFGIQFNENGTHAFQGQFKNNLYHGYGQTSHYQGEFQEGKRSGWGKYKNSSKNIQYEGMWKNGLFQGVGLLNVSKNQIQKFINQEQFLKEGQPLKYVGEWAGGFMDGRGKIAKEEEIYQGQIKKGFYYGEGKAVGRDGTVREGKFYGGVFV